MGQETDSNKDLEEYIPISLRESTEAKNAAFEHHDLTSTESQVVYINKKGILFHADCLNLLSGIKNESIDLVFADPPFNLGKNYDTTAYSDSMSTEAYKNWCRIWMNELVRVLRPGGSLTIYSWPRWIIEVGG